MEEKILQSFKKTMKKKIEGLDLLVVIPDNFDEEHECEIMETKSNGKVWTVSCTKNGNIKRIIELY